MRGRTQTTQHRSCVQEWSSAAVHAGWVEVQADRAGQGRTGKARPLTLHCGRFEDDGEVRGGEYLRGAAVAAAWRADERGEGGGREAIGDAGGGVHAMPTWMQRGDTTTGSEGEIAGRAGE